MGNTEKYLSIVQNLHVNIQGTRRSPHKPLLLLVAISKLIKGTTRIPFKEVQSELLPLLEAFAPQVQSRHQPELPYWHLRTDKIWEVESASDLPLQKGGFPKMGALKQTSGKLKDGFIRKIQTDLHFAETVVSTLLESYFPESLHKDILDAVDISIHKTDNVGETIPQYQTVNKSRDPKFSGNVLRAYEHRCAVSGFRAALGGRYFGCEAAHVQWHAYQGPDILQNGIALAPTIHKLFDAGAWTLTDDLRVLVSAELTGSSETVERLRSFHGKRLRKPLLGYPDVSVEYIHWHKDPQQGGVFRHPALEL
jgi:putative restriction endonuclease